MPQTEETGGVGSWLSKANIEASREDGYLLAYYLTCAVVEALVLIARALKDVDRSISGTRQTTPPGGRA